MESTYATPKTIPGTLPHDWIQHEHDYRLSILAGRVVCLCACGEYIEAEEIERRINEQG